MTARHEKIILAIIGLAALIWFAPAIGKFIELSFEFFEFGVTAFLVFAVVVGIPAAILLGVGAVRKDVRTFNANRQNSTATRRIPSKYFSATKGLAEIVLLLIASFIFFWLLGL